MIWLWMTTNERVCTYLIWGCYSSTQWLILGPIFSQMSSERILSLELQYGLSSYSHCYQSLQVSTFFLVFFEKKVLSKNFSGQLEFWEVSQNFKEFTSWVGLVPPQSVRVQCRKHSKLQTLIDLACRFYMLHAVNFLKEQSKFKHHA